VPDGENFDLILANLPYVAETDWPGLQREVTGWEPREALLAGPDGLDSYRALLSSPMRILSCLGRQNAHSRGALALEVGEGQSDAVVGLLEAAGFNSIRRLKDLAGIERVVVGER
jgi:release factor glutamine methyltransferase